MKLVIRQYLAALRERDELDALLPDLLSQMGLNVFSKPSVGGRQYGVDVAAVGCLDGGAETVYLFSVKSGDLGRADWDGGSVQALRPSLNDILDTYIPMHLPAEHRGKPIQICLCFGGDVKENVRLSVTGFLNKHETDAISLKEWNGEVLAALIEEHFLREELLLSESRPLLRKSLALLDEPEASYKYFKQLIDIITAVDSGEDKGCLTALRQMNICLWILYAWCRDQNNIEAAYLSGELVALYAWDMSKPYLGKTKKLDKEVHDTLYSILRLHSEISGYYVEKLVIPHVGSLYALSNATRPSCATDVNLKLFDVLGRVALSGLWREWHLIQLKENDQPHELIAQGLRETEELRRSLVQLIANNPMLFTPYKDDQAIDIALAVWFLTLDKHYLNDVSAWLYNMISSSVTLLNGKGPYPCNLTNYYELIEHPRSNEDGYFEKVTAGSILYPMIALFSEIFGFEQVTPLIKLVQKEFLGHCNFQAWFPDQSTETHIYRNSKSHGAIVSGLDLTDGSSLRDTFAKECEESPELLTLSATHCWPLILVACRHYRLPIPAHFFINLKSQ